MSLNELGLSDSVREAYESLDRPGRILGRVVAPYRGGCLVATEDGDITAVPRRNLEGDAGPPVVGDWVALAPPASPSSPAAIEAILPRRTKLSRTVAGARSDEQAVAANVDIVFLLMGLDGDFNLRRIERLATMAWSSGAEPVVVLTKADLAADVAARVAAVEACTPGVPVLALSSLAATGLEALGRYLRPGRTVTLIGSSGVGKSTLINTLAGRSILATGAVRAGDDRGRHTTTHRELIRLPSGALVIDNPGIRELQLWAGDDASEGLDRTFDDIERRARRCRFRDCSHEDEPGCAVRDAIDRGEIAPERLANRRALQKELRFQALRQDDAARRAQERRQGAFYKRVQAAKKKGRRDR